MTPKEKAFELVYKYYKITKEFEFIKGEGLVPYYGSAKQCALIAVDEMMEVYVSACVSMGMSKEDAEKKQSKYLQEVKTEIEKL
jgi:hypothetical protein